MFCRTYCTEQNHLPVIDWLSSVGTSRKRERAKEKRVGSGPCLFFLRPRSFFFRPPAFSGRAKTTTTFIRYYSSQARLPAAFFSGRVDQTREGSGNRAYTLALLLFFQTYKLRGKFSSFAIANNLGWYRVFPALPL